MKSSGRSERIECAILAGLSIGLVAGSGSLVWWSVFIFLPFLFLFFRKAALLCAVAAVIYGFASSFYQINELRGITEKISPEDYARGEFKLRLCDPRQTSLDTVDHPVMVTSELLEYKVYPEDKQKAEDIPVMVKLPSGFPAQKYGTVITGRGTVSNSRDRGFANYLAARKIAKSIYLDHCEVLGREKGISGYIIDFRDCVAARVLSKIGNENSRNQASALFFGMTGGMSRERRSVFVDTGTIHVFSVSGMHVAVLAFFLFLLFKPCGMRPAYILTLIFTGVYVVSTGASAPALRAFAMLSLWVIMRMFCCWMTPFSVFCWASVFLLATDPLLVLDIGARYSIVITGVLVAVSEKLKYLNYRKLIQYRMKVYGGSKLKLSIWRRNWDKVLPALIICVAAFAGGVAISMHHQGQLLPASVPVNLLLMPFLSVFYLLLGVVLIYPGAGVLLSAAFGILHGFCQIAADISSNIRAASPSAFELWLYIFLLFIILRCRKTLRLSAAVLLFSLFLRWLLIPGTENFHIVVYGTGRTTPPLVAFVDSKENNALIVDPAKSSASAWIADHLKRCGVTRVEAVIFTANSVKNMRGFRTLARRCAIGRVVVPPPSKYERIKYFRTALADSGVKNVTELDKSAEKLKIIRQKSTVFLEYFDRGAKLKIGLVLKKLSSAYQVGLKGTERVVEPLLLDFDGVERIQIYEFGK